MLKAGYGMYWLIPPEKSGLEINYFLVKIVDWLLKSLTIQPPEEEHLRFLYDGSYEEFRKKLNEMGETPFQSISKEHVEPSDEERYQTIYAKHEGAVAAPTAGLHFSKHLLKRLEIKGINLSELTLHVGLGTFNPVEVEDLSKHRMDSEEVFIPESTADAVNKALDTKKRVCAVGTTVMRSMESSVSADAHLKPYEGWTNKFIFPPYEFSVANCMITNFHTPKSTLDDDDFCFCWS